jgi:predicted phosphoribosyltransferase
VSDERFADRAAAGRALAERLAGWRGRADVVVLALPRGGVPVAHEVARALGAPLDLCLVRKLGVPGHEELAMGALASGGEPQINFETVRALRIRDADIARVIERERRELERREAAYRAGRAPIALAGRTVILVDDGLATGATMLAAADAVRTAGAAHVVVAVPVASEEACALLRAKADEVVAVLVPDALYAVGAWYTDFTQTTDEEVRALLS